MQPVGKHLRVSTDKKLASRFYNATKFAMSATYCGLINGVGDEITRLFKNDEWYFFFILKALVVLKIFKCLF